MRESIGVKVSMRGEIEEAAHRHDACSDIKNNGMPFGEIIIDESWRETRGVIGGKS